MARLIGITGGIGAGKSSLARILASYGHVVIDADVLARAVVDEPPVRAGLVALLGPGAYDAAGRYDRSAVRTMVFADPRLREGLEAIMHPAIAALFATHVARIDAACATAWIFYEASLLVEAGRMGDFDALVLVTAPLETRLARVGARSGLTRDAALAIARSQADDEVKMAHATDVVNNDGPPQILERGAGELLVRLRERFAARAP